MPCAIARSTALIDSAICRIDVNFGSAMTSILSTSLSGINAAQLSMSASATNIANLGVDGFRREQVQLSAAAPAGVTATLGQAASPGEDLAADVVGLLEGKNAMLANLAVFKSAARTTGSLLDVLA
jgi:flagellar basal body rod protein FlgG